VAWELETFPLSFASATAPLTASWAVLAGPTGSALTAASAMSVGAKGS